MQNESIISGLMMKQQTPKEDTVPFCVLVESLLGSLQGPSLSSARLRCWKYYKRK